MERCLARRIHQKKRDLFQSGINYNGTKRPGYYTEHRCQNNAVSGKNICDSCIDIRISERDPNLNPPACWHGFVNEPIESDRIFGGPGFLKNAAAYGISQEGLERGISAHNDAVKGLNGVPPLPDMSVMVKKEVTEPPPKKTRVKKETTSVKKPSKIKIVAQLAQTSVLEAMKIQESVEVPLVVAELPLPLPAPQAPVKRKKKTVTTAPPPPPIAILSEEKPIDVDNVETIEVILKHIDGTDYYLDTRKSKLYNPNNGLCNKKWDSVRQIIIPYDDSDHE